MKPLDSGPNSGVSSQFWFQAFAARLLRYADGEVSTARHTILVSHVSLSTSWVFEVEADGASSSRISQCTLGHLCRGGICTAQRHGQSSAPTEALRRGEEAAAACMLLKDFEVRSSQMLRGEILKS